MFIIPWMTTGGADRVNLDLVEGLTGKGHDVTICATLSADHVWEHQFGRFTPDIFILPNILHASDYPRFLAYLIQSRKIDTVVITGSTIGYQLLPYLRAVSSGVAFVDMCHVEEPHWLNGGHPRFGVGYQDVLDLNIVTNGHLAEWMRNRGADGERIRVMYTGVRVSRNGHPDEVRIQVRSELNIEKDISVIVFAGRICEQKRPALLAAILRASRDQGLIFRALIIGDGELKTQLEDLLGQYQLTDSVQMLGSVPHQRWLDILVAADILLMPSLYEGISIALLESMAAGVVPVVANVGGTEELVSQDAGVLIPHGVNELQEYVDAIRRLLSNPAELQQMSNQCKALAASKLSWDGMIDNFLALLNEAHQLRIDHPRYPISLNFGCELASQLLPGANNAATAREQIIAAMQAQVQDLQKDNAWLSSQREAWEKVAAEREQIIAVMQAQVQDLQTGNTWLSSQREAWEKVAAEREQSIAALTSRLHDTAERLSLSGAILNKIRNHWGMRFVKFLSKINISK